MATPPKLTIVMPAYNASGYLPRTITAISSQMQSDWEFILSDDGSTDDTARVAEQYGAQVIRSKESCGPAAARNLAVQHARGDVIVFVDADVELHPEAVSSLHDALSGNPAIAAVFGSYDAQPADPHTVSVFRNLLHHYVHQTGAPEASTFWTGCSAIRKSVLEDVGPFRPVSITCIEDIDYGHRMRDLGYRIQLRPDIQGKHLKRWTLLSMIRTDFRHRGIPWTIMMLRRGKSDSDLNLSARHRYTGLCAVLVSAGFSGGIVGLACSHAPGAAMGFTVAMISLFAMVFLQRRFYNYLYSLRGPGFLVPAIGLHLLYYHVSVAALVAGSLLYLFRYRTNAKDINDIDAAGRK